MAASTQQAVIDQISQQATQAMLSMEDGTADSMSAAFAAARSNILARIQASFPGESWNLQNMQAQRIQAMLAAINQQIAALSGVLTDTTMGAVTDQFQTSQEYSAYMLDQATPPNVGVNWVQPPVSAIRAALSTPFQGAMFSQRYGAVSDAMASDIRDQLTQSMINGESMDDAASRVEGVMGDAGTGYENRALTIARTEIMRSQNLAAYDLFQNQNANLMKDSPEWQATADDRLCPWCLGRDGKTEEQVKKLHLSARGRSDPFHGSAVMPLHPHCRCRWLPRLKSWKELGVDIPDDAADDARVIRDSDGNLAPATVQSFNDWRSNTADVFGLKGGGL